MKNETTMNLSELAATGTALELALAEVRGETRRPPSFAESRGETCRRPPLSNLAEGLGEGKAAALARDRRPTCACAQ